MHKERGEVAGEQPCIPPSSWLARARAAAAVDFHVLATLLFRGWSVFAGAATLLLIPLWLSPTEQGYYYTFASLIALQIFFELGMNQVILQTVGHEMAHLRFDDKGRLSGDLVRLDRLTSLTRLLRHWYLAAASLFVLGVGCAGFYFFAKLGDLPAQEWLVAWVALVVATGANVYLSPAMAVLEGCGQVGNVARIRMLQSMAGYLSMWVALSLHAGLLAVPLIPIFGAAFTSYWLHKHGTALHWLRGRALSNALNKVRWRIEIFPFQWRIALSWISGYFIFQLFTPMVFANQGPEEAGRLGIAFSMFSAVLSIGMSWVNAKTPIFAAHISRGERQALNALFVNLLKRSMVFTAVACLLLLATVQFMTLLGWPLVQRVATMPVLLGIAAVTVANNFIFAAAAYMRAHKEEPMLWPSMLAGVLVLAAVHFASRHSVVLTTSLYALITVGISVPLTVAIFLRYYKR